MPDQPLKIIVYSIPSEYFLEVQASFPFEIVYLSSPEEFDEDQPHVILDNFDVSRWVIDDYIHTVPKDEHFDDTWDKIIQSKNDHETQSLKREYYEKFQEKQALEKRLDKIKYEMKQIGEIL